MFGTACTPETPIGTCMVSSEGACAAYYNFGRMHREAAVVLGRKGVAAGMTAPAVAGRRVRHRIRVTGVVQGVGFRPFVYRLAAELELAGHVGNDSDGVFVEVEGGPEEVAVFGARLRSDAPGLARIDRLEIAALAPVGERGFTMVASRVGQAGRTYVSPDVAVCGACLAELFDPTDRRYRYPFINCTDCGPRFTITLRLPYDRPNTTMAGFPLCPDCTREYHDPRDRRFHAQPIACPVCGPRLWFEPSGEGPTPPWSPPSGCWPRAGSSRSKDSAASTWPVTPRRARWWPSCAGASTGLTNLWL